MIGASQAARKIVFHPKNKTPAEEALSHSSSSEASIEKK
jgi:hypothetical protein